MKTIYHKLFVAALVALFASSLSAASRQMEQIRDIASQVLHSPVKTDIKPARRMLSHSDAATRDYFYLLEGENGGFVIVSADDRMPAVLGYSLEGDFPQGEIPEHIQYVFDSWIHSIKAVEAGEMNSDEAFPAARLREADADAVGPLLGDIMYDQGYPYNLKCPSARGQNCLTGCIATALAQIMRYYSYPAVGTGTFDFGVKDTGKTYSIDISTLPFDWNNILPNYNGNFSQTQANAVASLMYAIGAAVHMNYGFDGSGTQSDYVRPALVDNFGYSNSAYLIQGSNDSPVDKPYNVWIPTIIDEIKAGRPVYFAGAPGGNGHAFVLDGYEGVYVDNVEDVLFHINWGWGGSMNGMFYLNNLTPDGINFAGFRSEWVANIMPPTTALDNVTLQHRLTDGVIYNILGQTVSPDQLQTGNIYIQDGRKFLLR